MTAGSERKEAKATSGKEKASGQEGTTSPEEARAEYTIDELAAVTGVPSRTIRFYQANGVLPFPRRQGRVAVYDDGHIERLKLVADMQNRGLRLRAVRDLLSRPDFESSSVQQWLGLEKQMKGYAQDAPRVLDAEQLEHLTGEQPASVIARLLRSRLVEHDAEGPTPRFFVQSPRLLQIALQLEREGVAVEKTVAIFDILQRRLSRTAEEVVQSAVENEGKGARGRAAPRDLKRVFDALFAGNACSEAVQAVFAREVDRAVAALLKREVSGARRGRGWRGR